MGSSNPVRKVMSGAEDAYGSVQDNLQKSLTYGAFPSVGSVGLPVDAAKRAREDMKDQAAGQAQSEIERARAAERLAIDRSVKDLDPLALERRRRASLAGTQGRGGTLLTPGTSLGAADVARKTLLGM